MEGKTLASAPELGRRPSLMPNLSAPAIARGSSAEAGMSLGQLMAAYAPVFNQLAQQQRGQIDALAGGLNNVNTQQALNALGASMDSAGTMERMAGEELALGRSLSPEQLREATQSARGAFAARGLGTSMGSSAAEILNRDAYASQREQQRRTFASNLLDASGAMRQRGAALYPQLDPYARAIQPGLALGQSAQQFGLNTAGGQFNNMLGLFGNVGSFNVNRGDNLRTNWMDNAAAIRGANMSAQGARDAANAAKPQWYETALGAVSNIFSDKRMKADIKPLGKAGNVLGLTAYEFRYKGEKEKHKGFMAQDVQKVLPEAVEEVEYQGKKRLTIKPAVIGAALSQELMTAKAA